MSANDKLRQLQIKIGHVFINPQLGIDSLYAAGAVTGDGHKLLALTGDALLRLVLVNDMYGGGLTKGQIQNTVSRIGSNSHIHQIGLQNGISDLIIKDNSQRFDPPSAGTIATAVEAIIAAVWYDTDKDLGVVTEVMATIGLWPEE